MENKLQSNSSVIITDQEVWDRIRSADVFQARGDFKADDLPGVYLNGVHYYDLGTVDFINHTGIANLIDILKYLLEQGIKVQFVNVSEAIRNKIRHLGLDHILICH
jgi:hypothetical protein